jgi:hypothetical protein
MVNKFYLFNKCILMSIYFINTFYCKVNGVLVKYMKDKYNG